MPVVYLYKHHCVTCQLNYLLYIASVLLSIFLEFTESTTDCLNIGQFLLLHILAFYKRTYVRLLERMCVYVDYLVKYIFD